MHIRTAYRDIMYMDCMYRDCMYRDYMYRDCVYSVKCTCLRSFEVSKISVGYPCLVELKTHCILKEESRKCRGFTGALSFPRVSEVLLYMIYRIHISFDREILYLRITLLGYSDLLCSMRDIHTVTCNNVGVCMEVMK